MRILLVVASLLLVGCLEPSQQHGASMPDGLPESPGLPPDFNLRLEPLEYEDTPGLRTITHEFTLSSPAWFVLNVHQSGRHAYEEEIHFQFYTNDTEVAIFTMSYSTLWWSMLLGPGVHDFYTNGGKLGIETMGPPLYANGSFHPPNAGDPLSWLPEVPENFSVQYDATWDGLGYTGNDGPIAYISQGFWVLAPAQLDLNIQPFNDQPTFISVILNSTVIENIEVDSNSPIASFVLSEPGLHRLEILVHATFVEVMASDPPFSATGEFQLHKPEAESI